MSPLPPTLASSRLDIIHEALKDRPELRNERTVPLECFEGTDQGIGIRHGHGTCSPAGSLVLESKPLRMAIEPRHWQTHCGQCGACHHAQLCCNCRAIGHCSHCNPKLWHNQRECDTLRVFRRLCKGDEKEEPQLYLSEAHMTTHLLALRLLCANPNIDAVRRVIATRNSSSSSSSDEASSKSWKLFQAIYKSDRISEYDTYIATTIVEALRKELSQHYKSLEVSIYSSILGRILGCSHAVTDLSRPLGDQMVGRTIFLEHSFYNHSCTPNAFLSCRIPPPLTTNASLRARVYLTTSVAPGEDITLSYIPLSGLSRQERQARLQEQYGFSCDCPSCQRSTKPLSPMPYDNDVVETATSQAQSSTNEDLIPLPQDADVDSIREVQYSCSERLLTIAESSDKPMLRRSPSRQKGNDTDSEQREDALEQIMSLVKMTQRGMKNQEIPDHHEVQIEAHRLLAMANSLIGRWEEALVHHEQFLDLAGAIGPLFDPVALATQRLAYAKDVRRLLIWESNKYDTVEGKASVTRLQGIASHQWSTAIEALTAVLGHDHPWLLKEKQSVKNRSDNVDVLPSKKQKIG